MVIKKKVHHGSNGFNILNIPRAPRSCRRKVPLERNFEESEICAIELLALAGKMLQESESSSASNYASEGNHSPEIGEGLKQEQQDEYKVLKTEYIDQGSSDINVSLSGSMTESNDQKCLLTGFPYAESGGIGQCASMSGCLDNVAVKLKPRECGDLKPLCNSSNKRDEGSLLRGHSCDKVNKGFGQPLEADGLRSGRSSVANTIQSKDPTEFCKDFPTVITADTNTKSSLGQDPVPNVSFSRRRNFTKLGSRDDDESSSRCKFSNKLKAYRPPTRIGDRRIRKLLASKYWKVGPKLKDVEYARADGSLKTLYRKRKPNYSYDWGQYDNLYKRRKVSDRNSILTSDGDFSCESVSNSPEKDMMADASDLAASRASSPVAGFHSRDAHVKVRIKSFKIPELFVQVPETATVGSLKRTVLDAVTALLGGGIRVGVVLQGKKVRDDNRTLSQTGLSCKENLDALGFTLEPVPKKFPPPLCSEDPPLSLPADAADFSKRSPATPSGPSSCPDAQGPTLTETHAENSTELVPSEPKILTEEPLSECRALVPVPSMNVEALAVVPVNQKPKRSDLAQRRTRRPFSVSEVEALVEAVEELGTGRWRDVKLRAFENADHRTYVDLKDKWKTLVHTASIAPQQRRGEPVPQHLLDRVLAAHSHWSLHQGKQHGKHHAGAPRIAADEARALQVV